MGVIVEESKSIPPGTFAATSWLMELADAARDADVAGTDTEPVAETLGSGRDMWSTG